MVNLNYIRIFKRRLFSLGLALALLLTGGLAAQAAAVTVELNGQVLNYTLVAPQIINDRVMVPIRETGNFLGMVTEWDEPTSTMIFTKDNFVVLHKLNQTYLTVNGVVKSFDTPSQAINNYTVMPVRMLAEAIGATVSWDGNNQKVVINTATSGASPSGITPMPTVSPASITNVNVGNETLELGNSTDVLVFTNNSTARVFVKDNLGNTVASVYSYGNLGTAREWTLTITPTQRGTLTYTVYAYNGQGQEATKTFTLSVGNASEVSINEVNVDSKNVDYGDRVYVEVYTSNTVTSVWIEDSDGKNLDETDDYDREGRERVWELDFTPKKTGTYYVYAEDDSRHEEYESFKLTVSGSSSSSSRSYYIYEVELDENEYQSGDEVYARVYTTSDVVEAWVENSSGKKLDYDTSSKKSGSERVWELYFDVTKSGYYSFYVVDDDDEEEYEEVYIKVK